MTTRTTPAARKGGWKAGSALALLFSLGLLGGCSIGDDFIRPVMDLPSLWTTKVDAIQEKPPEWPTPEWWQGFNSPHLNRLITAAEQANYDIGAAVARVRQADAQLRIAGASLFPQVQGDASFTRSRSALATTSTGTFGGGSNVRYNNAYSLGLSASYEIDFWGKNRSARDAAAATAVQSRYDARTAQLTVQTSVASTYFDMVGQNERLAVARETVANAESVLAAIRDRFVAGTASSLDVAQQESVVAVQRATIPPLEQQIRQDANALAILTGVIPERFELEPEQLASIALPIIQPGLASELLARRPDVQSAEYQLVAANANITNARAQLFPSISLTGQGGLQSGALENLLLHNSLFYSAGSSLTQIIFDGGRLFGQVDLNRARYDELVNTYGKTVLTAFSDVENALIAIQKTAEEEDAQRVNVATSRNAYEIAQSLFRAGTVDITTVLNTQRALFTAQDQLAQAKLLHLQAVVTLYKALGGGWSAPVMPPQ